MRRSYSVAVDGNATNGTGAMIIQCHRVERETATAVGAGEPQSQLSLLFDPTRALLKLTSIAQLDSAQPEYVTEACSARGLALICVDIRHWYRRTKGHTIESSLSDQRARLHAGYWMRSL